MKLSRAFKLNRTQSELDFVNVELDGDTPLFLDPFPLSQRTDTWSTECHHLIVDCFQKVIDAIRTGRTDDALYILEGFGEPDETRLGLSKGKRPRGRGIGPEQALDLHKRLSESRAAKTGFIRDLEDCQLVIPGINRDKVSDITTNIIRHKLAEYTEEQCQLHNIPTEEVAIGPGWDPHISGWRDQYGRLPIHRNLRLLLVPKAISRYDLSYDYHEYYNRFVLEHLRAEQLNAGTSLVRTLKNGERVVRKKDLKKAYPLSKEFLYEYSRDNPDVIDRYKKAKRQEIAAAPVQKLEEFTEAQADDFIERLLVIPAGNKAASDYHQLMIGILEAIFYPALTFPKKEEEIHEGRKRIDITYRNSDSKNFFLHLSKDVPCSFIMIECKNYRSDISNPELDQMAGRFSPNRGQFGIIVCRTFEDRDLFYDRCRDTAQDGRGYIVALDDKDIATLLIARSHGDEKAIHEHLVALYRKLVM